MEFAGKGIFDPEWVLVGFSFAKGYQWSVRWGLQWRTSWISVEHLLPGAEPSSVGIGMPRSLEICSAGDLRSVRAIVSGQGEFVMVLSRLGSGLVGLVD